MGCCLGKNSKSEPKITRLPFSWELRQSRDIADFILKDVCNGEVLRSTGDINGQQFVIQNCQNSEIYIFDHCNSVTIDDCVNCTIILGSVRGSVYLRGCQRTILITSCGQFRTRDCQKCQLFIYSATQPIIESSTGMSFGSNKLSYNHLQMHLEAAGLNPQQESWLEVFDFTPVPAESNWRLIQDHAVDKLCLKTRSKDFEERLRAMSATWAGKLISAVVLESTV